MEFVDVKFSNYLNIGRMVAAGMPKAAPIKRAVATARENGKLIDLTGGRKTISVIFADNDAVIITHITLASIINRIQEGGKINGRND